MPSKSDKTKTKTTTTKKPKKVSAREAAEVVLLSEGRPMHYREISKVALERGIVAVRGGKRPNPARTMKTMRSYLAGCAQQDVKFVRIEPGVFDLKDRTAKSEQKTKSAS
jgi:hypothetical protein